MKRYLLILLFANAALAHKNSLYTELGGAGYLMTLNYERMLTEKIITRVGYGSHGSDNKINFLSGFLSIPSNSFTSSIFTIIFDF